jgi:hypothetical protein
MKKAIIVNGNNFEFGYDENLRIWRILESPHIIDGLTIDVEIDMANVGDGMDWSQVVKFLDFLQNNKAKIVERIEDAKRVLVMLFRTINKDVYDHEFMRHLKFNVAGIDYKGLCKLANMENYFEYDYFFFPQYELDRYRDIGSFIWRATFRDTLLLGVSCDRM